MNLSSIVQKANGSAIAPSILSADFSILRQEVKTIEEGGADLAHVDVMDGHFVPNLTIGPGVVSAIRPHTKLPLDCHLMVSEPEKWVEPFAKAGADIITIHAEVAKDLKNLIQEIQSKNILAGVSINPQTPISKIESVLDLVDLVLVMSVNPGFGGQSFIESSVNKVKDLKKLQSGKKFLIEIDGGVNSQNIGTLKKAGVDVFVAGSAVFKGGSPKASIQELRDSMK